MQAGKLVAKALQLEAEGVSGPAALAEVVEGQGHAPMVSGLAAKIERALRARERRAEATEQDRDGSGRFA